MKKIKTAKINFITPDIVDEEGNTYTITIDGRGIDWRTPEIMSAIYKDKKLLKKYLATQRAKATL
jgi:hypothetical protein